MKKRTQSVQRTSGCTPSYSYLVRCYSMDDKYINTSYKILFYPCPDPIPPVFVGRTARFGPRPRLITPAPVCAPPAVRRDCPGDPQCTPLTRAGTHFIVWGGPLICTTLCRGQCVRVRRQPGAGAPSHQPYIADFCSTGTKCTPVLSCLYVPLLSLRCRCHVLLE